MYPTSLTTDEQAKLAKLYVGWLYYYHRHPICDDEFEYLDGYNLVKLLLGYTPSVYRDDLMVKFYTTKCLTCGSIDHSMRLEPYHEECFYCANQDHSDTLTILPHYQPTNPMDEHFHMLPVSVQNIIHDILLDSETHPLYNVSRIEEYRDE